MISLHEPEITEKDQKTVLKLAWEKTLESLRKFGGNNPNSWSWNKAITFNKCLCQRTFTN